MHSTFSDRRLLDLLSERYGSIYAAVNIIAKLARYRAEKCNNLILHSEALNWVITGERPKVLDKPRRPSTYVQDTAEYYTDHVLNIDVCISVIRSILESDEINTLKYVYEDSLNEYEQAKVRVLCNIIWEEIRS